MLLVHNTAPFRLIRAAAPHMREAAKQEIEATGKAAPRSIINVRCASLDTGCAFWPRVLFSCFGGAQPTLDLIHVRPSWQCWTGQLCYRCTFSLLILLRGKILKILASQKAGLLGLTKTIAKEWGMFNIRCNAVGACFDPSSYQRLVTQHWPTAFGRINTRLTAAKQKDNFIEIDGKKVALGIPSKPLPMWWHPGALHLMLFFLQTRREQMMNHWPS